MDAKDNKSKASNNVQSSLCDFMTTMGTNIGVSLSSQKKKEKFNPYSAENQSQVQEIYDVMSSYQSKTSERDIKVPKNVSISRNGKKAQFEFESEIKAEVFDEIVDNKGYRNISLNDSSNVIEITK